MKHLFVMNTPYPVRKKCIHNCSEPADLGMTMPCLVKEKLLQYHRRMILIEFIINSQKEYGFIEPIDFEYVTSSKRK